MNSSTAGLLAGCVASAVLAVVMVALSLLPITPDLDLLALLTRFVDVQYGVGWLVYFAVGIVVYGGVMALLCGKAIYSSVVSQGVLLGLLGWATLMVVLLPLMGHGLFGLRLQGGLALPAMALLLHVVFGLVLGAVYSKLLLPQHRSRLT